MRFAIAFLILAITQALRAQDDVLLKAMRDELKRSMTLKVPGLENPYYIEYVVDEGTSYSAAATLGGLISSEQSRFRVPRVRVRVGGYDFDNTNYIASNFQFGSRYDIDRFPLDASYSVLRRYLWLATDQSYKSALQAISRKRAALKSISTIDPLPDFSKAESSRIIRDITPVKISFDSWLARTRNLSGIFAGYPKLKNSNVEISITDQAHYFVNSEGSEQRIPSVLGLVRIRASGQAADGMSVRDSAVFQSHEIGLLQSEAEMQRVARTVADNVTALVQAPFGETWTGPVLFEGAASAQVFAQLIGENLSLTRKPVMEPGRPGSIPVSELEGRQGARILPETFDITDDPTQAEWRGHPLFGHYEVDDEGVVPKPLAIVEKGVLKNFLLTRQPMRGFGSSNGRARLPGNFGANTAVASTLFVRSTESTPLADLKKKMVDICRQRNKPYGMVVRKMDFPSSASVDEVRRILSGAGQSSGARSISPPLLVYRVYLDGREELVRGLRFRGFNARSLKDILAVGDDANLFDYLENGIPFALMGAGSSMAESTVIAPSILVDDLELLKIEDEQPKLPIVPPPTTVSMAISPARR
ncbi:MAG: metallopeptidase TldD-related protein [Acidobacteriota bacterium]|nr:metallopeptidase TldD-related protein [Acidobacteriota bacterium]